MIKTLDEFKEELFEKIKILNITAWEFKVEKPLIENWLKNFTNDKEKIHALYLLSQFMYFGNKQMRELLKIIYSVLFKYRIIEKIRKNKNNTVDLSYINKKYNEYLLNTRFLAVGNPSESGSHLLYYYRQENKLSKKLFVNSHEIMGISKNLKKFHLKFPKIIHYVFIDDFCGTGDQAKSYSKEIVEFIKKLNNKVEIDYLTLFSTKDGINNVRKDTMFSYVDAVFELDNSYKCFEGNSRYFLNQSNFIDKQFALNMCKKYGKKLYYSLCLLEGLDKNKSDKLSELHSLGYKNSQLLLGFNHNTPDNTLPIIWYDEDDLPWTPIFKRYNKKYGN